MVVAVSTGVTNRFPVNKIVPPEATPYQLICDPAASMAESVNEPGPQEENGVFTGIGAAGKGMSVTEEVPETVPVQVEFDIATSE